MQLKTYNKYIEIYQTGDLKTRLLSQVQKR